MRTLLPLFLLACGGRPTPDTVPTPAPALSPPSTPAVFNAAALARGLPVAWVQDDGDGLPQPGEIVSLWADPPAPSWFDEGAPSAELLHLWASMGTTGALPADPTEAKRRALVREELALTRPAVVFNDLREVPAWERRFVRAMEEVARQVEVLHRRQRVAPAYRTPATDPESQALFQRNQGPWCEQPTTSVQAACGAIEGSPPRTVGVYPADIQEDPVFCDTLQAQGLLDDPFTVVVRDDQGVLVTQPYSEAFGEEGVKLAELLSTAAGALPPEEAPLNAYLIAVVKAMGDNDWFAADTAWAAMNAQNSRFYVRVGPDEVYWDPCNRHAGFAMVLAHIDPNGLAWQARLEPQRAELERIVAEHAGPPYTAREVAFAMPEFIHILLNAGDARSPFGATIGQSLPNWGPVADSGGRTVAMTNMGTDAGSQAINQAQAASLLCSLEHYSADPEHLLLSTLLHEAAHNLGPAQNYTIDGQTDEQLFGGELASMLEELKAQSAALTLTDHLVREGVVTQDFAHRTHTADLVWSLGKVATGLRDASGTLKPYPSLAAIQLGLLEEAGAIRWEAEGTAANGEDVGCLAVDYAALGPAMADLATRTIGAKARGDVGDVQAMVEAYVDGANPARLKLYTERWSRAKQPTYVYGLRLE